MKQLDPPFRTLTIDGVVEPSHRVPNGPSTVMVYTGDDAYTAWTWLLMPDSPGEYVRTASVTLIPVDDEMQSEFILTAMRAKPDRDIFDLIPWQFGTNADVVFRCRKIVDAIETPAVRRFVSRVFSIPEIYHGFWTCPASQKHHHNWSGGLAGHSIEMAESVLATPLLKDGDRDLAVAYALVHDVGKIWCYDNSGGYAEPLGHDLAALEHLHESLRQLKGEWPDGAVVLSSLLSGIWRHRGGRPIMAIGKLVQGLDQLSTEQDLRASVTCDPRFKPWTPSSPHGEPAH